MNSQAEPNADPYLLYATAVILPVLAFPAWFLCIPPFIWHFSQRNIAAWSLVLWIILMNFFNFINPLIWPRDNVSEWYNGEGLCDIEVRIFVGISVALASCTAMIMRKLAKVMDTGNIEIAPSRKKLIREKVLEVLWCWGYPAFMILIYYVVQPLRYYIFGISGCIVAYNLSWVSIVLGAMWPNITICFASYHAGLLIYRLYLYRREFHRLIAARDTTKSRFIRLFVMSAIIIVIMLPYSFWILWLFASELTEKYTWSSVHGADWNSVVKMPAYGQVRLDKWGQVATGYCAFFVFGTGSDANNTYKKMLCAIGLGYIFPSLNRRSESGSSTPSSFVAARGWLSTCSSKAKDFFSRSTTVTETLQTKTVSTRNNSVTVETILLDTPRSGSFHPVATNEPMIAQQPPQASNGSKSFFGRLFPRRNRQPSVLPLFAQPRGTERTETEKSPTETLPPGIYSQAWASDSPTTAVPRDSGGGHGVHVVKELHQKDNLSDTPKE